MRAASSRRRTDRRSKLPSTRSRIAQFEQAGELGSPNEWDRYSYSHAEVVLDKLDGRIAGLVAKKGVLPPRAARDIAARALYGYINSYHRSAKNAGLRLTIEARLDAAESVEVLARGYGLGQVVDSWEPDLSRLRG